MDVAIGQAVTMDDPVWHELLILLADWKLTEEKETAINQNAAYASKLTVSDKAFIRACADYYQNGRFPEEFVSTAPPPLVTSELTTSLEAARQAADVNINQDLAARSMANLGSMR
jgi:hypothetical protein